MKLITLSRWRRSLMAGAVCALAVLSGCTTVPITGRQQLNMMSDKEMIAAADKHHASFMTMATQKKAVASPSDSPEMAASIAMVQRVSDRIIDAAGLRGKYQWETTLIKSKQANASVRPNGKIVVFTGLLPITKDEAGLAAVIGHEVAHVVARHSAERASQVLLAQTAVAVAGAAAASRSNNPGTAIAVGAALGFGAQYGVLLPFSREHESEADRIGLLYMAKAGYDPAAAIGVWERMEQANGTGPWEFLSSHPSPSTRREQLRAWLPLAQQYYVDRSRPLPDNLAELERAQRGRAGTGTGAAAAAR